MDAPDRLDSLGLEPAERERLAKLCSREGAITKEEKRRLKAEAVELEDYVQTLLPGALDPALRIGASVLSSAKDAVDCRMLIGLILKQLVEICVKQVTQCVCLTPRQPLLQLHPIQGAQLLSR